MGGVGKAVLGYFMPYEEWPEDVKQYYRYDPEAAEKLLDEAGYPRGADGVRFKTIYEHYEFTDLGYYQIAMDYLREIGIDVEIQEVTRAEFVDKALNHTYLGVRNEVWAAEYTSAPGAIAAYWTKERLASHERQRPRIRRVLRERAGRYHHRGAEGVGAEGRHAGD